MWSSCFKQGSSLESHLERWKKKKKTIPGHLYSSKNSKIILMSLLSYWVVSGSLQSHELKHARLPCPSPSSQACSDLCPLSQWCHPTISSSVVPFSCLPSFPASGSFPRSRLSASGGQSIGASVLVFPMNIQDWFPLWLTGLISLQFKGLSRVFSNTTVQSISSSVLGFLYGPTVTSIHDY